MINIVRLRKLLPAVQQGGKTKEIADRLGITQTNLYSLLYSIGMSLKDLRKNQSLVELISDSQKMNRHLLELELCYIDAKQEHFFPALTQALQKVRERTRQRLEQPAEEKGEGSENPDIYW